jgi:sterol desaturase/sphingolipid hydroxylase (fatty acid hydroxylase superfamily)
LHIAAILDVALIGLFLLLAGAEYVSARGRAAVERPSDARLATNFGLGLLILLLITLAPAAKVGSALVAQAHFSGFAEHYAWPWLLALAVLVIGDSFAAYWTHRMMHAVPALWRIHRIHHADSEVDVSTCLRNHPLELGVTVPVSIALIVLIGAPPSAVMVSQTIMFAASMWQHADIDAPLAERVLGPWLITPATHRLHHSPDRATHDGNYGDLITLWDRLFGTFSRSKGRGGVGLDGQVARPDHLLEQILSPVYAPKRGRRSLDVSA